MIFGLVLTFLVGAESARAQAAHGAQGPEEGVIRRQLWLIPARDLFTMMRTSLYRPPGNGPFPLAVVNHGSTQNALQRAEYRRPEYLALVQWFVARGYAVAVPQRPGHGETGGPYYEDQGNCVAPDYRRAGEGAASSIAAVIGYLTRQPFVQKGNSVVLVGQSAGAWGALALGTYNPREVKAVVAFAPGRGGLIDGAAGGCVPDRLIAAARGFGEKSRVPTLWIYAQNDGYFPPDLSRKLVEGYRLAGGRAEFHLLPPFSSDGHTLIQAPEAVAIWGPLVENFLGRAK